MATIYITNDNAVNDIHLGEAFQMLNQDNCNATVLLVGVTQRNIPPLSARKRLLRQIKPFHLQPCPGLVLNVFLVVIRTLLHAQTMSQTIPNILRRECHFNGSFS